MAKKARDDLAFIDLSLLKMVLDRTNELILRTILRNVQVINTSIPPQRRNIELCNIDKGATGGVQSARQPRSNSVGLKRGSQRAILLNLPLGDASEGGQGPDAVRRWSSIGISLRALNPDKGGWVRSRELEHLECVALDADYGAIGELDFMPSTQGLCSADEPSTADEVPLGAVVAGDADAGAARENGIGVRVGAGGGVRTRLGGGGGEMGKRYGG